MQTSAFINDLVAPSTGTHALYIMGAMFDEVDEGTAMTKAASTIDDIPAEGTFLYLSIDGEEISSDFYLLLAQKYSSQFLSSREEKSKSPFFNHTNAPVPVPAEHLQKLKKKAYDFEVSRLRKTQSRIKSRI